MEHEPADTNTALPTDDGRLHIELQDSTGGIRSSASTVSVASSLQESDSSSATSLDGHRQHRQHAHKDSQDAGFRALQHEKDYKLQSKSILHKARHLGHKTKVKAKHALHIDHESENEEYLSADGDDLADELAENPGFNPQALIPKTKITPGSTVDRATSAVKTAAKAVSNPKKHAKNKTARKLAKSEHPFLTEKADQELFEAQQKLANLENHRDDILESDDEVDEDIEDWRETLRELEGTREAMQVAYVTSKYVSRARVVPKGLLKFPREEEFREYNEKGEYVRFKWEKYLGYWLVYNTQGFAAQYIDDFDDPPFDRDTVIAHVERIAMVSAPWQAWLTNLRAVYRWENPKKTMAYFVFWNILWQTDSVIAFLWFYSVFIVLKHRLRPTPVEDLKESYQRSVDQGSNIYKFHELIYRHGPDDWVDPMMQEFGPWLQLQLGDFADFLEVMVNYYNWKDPYLTTYSLFVLSMCFLICVLTDAQYCSRVFWFVCIYWFFFCRGIASRHPKYRHLISPFKWFFWGIPTHAEMAFQYLRRNAQYVREIIIERRVERQFTGEQTKANDAGVMPPSADMVTDPSPSLASTDLFRFYCAYRRDRGIAVPGRLFINTEGLRFAPMVPKTAGFKHAFRDLLELRKCTGSKIDRVVNLPPTEMLELVFFDGTSYLLEGFRGKKRDEVFNVIIGFSGLQWQQVQALKEQRGRGAGYRGDPEGDPHREPNDLVIGDVGRKG